MPSCSMYEQNTPWIRQNCFPVSKTVSARHRERRVGWRWSRSNYYNFLQLWMPWKYVSASTWQNKPYNREYLVKTVEAVKQGEQI